MTRTARDTPMMRQYLAVKAQHPDAIVFYRMGDFYEMFLADAEIAAPLLDITLTTRDRDKQDAVPMCGIPVHAADPHIKRLAELGYRIAICELLSNLRTGKAGTGNWRAAVGTLDRRRHPARVEVAGGDARARAPHSMAGIQDRPSRPFGCPPVRARAACGAIARMSGSRCALAAQEKLPRGILSGSLFFYSARIWLR